MDFAVSRKAEETLGRLQEFMDSHVFPAEPAYHEVRRSRGHDDQARRLCYNTAWLIDNYGVKGARTEAAAIKVIAPRVALNGLDRAIQVHGGAGVSDDVPLAEMRAGARTLRIPDGPDDVHVRSVARQELAPRTEAS